MGDLLAQTRSEQQPKWVANADYTMTILDRLVQVKATTANVNVTLPPVKEAAFLIFVIKLIEVNAGTYDLDVLVGDGAKGKTTVEALDPDAADDTIVLMSDGEEWHVLKSVIA